MYQPSLSTKVEEWSKQETEPSQLQEGCNQVRRNVASGLVP